MRLLGDANWYLPGWMSWLPDVRVEPAPSPVHASVVAAATGGD